MDKKQLSQKAYLIRAKEAFCRVCSNKECCNEHGQQNIDYRNKCGKLLEFSRINHELVLEEWRKHLKEKECSKCHKTYCVKNFYKSIYTLDGYTTLCRHCLKERRDLKAKDKKDTKKSERMIKEAKELETLIKQTDGIKYESRDIIARNQKIRYQYDEEYQKKIKQLSKEKYYSKDQKYIAKKYLKRHL